MPKSRIHRIITMLALLAVALLLATAVPTQNFGGDGGGEGTGGDDSAPIGDIHFGW
jgi:hypothetical protein